MLAGDGVAGPNTYNGNIWDHILHGRKNFLGSGYGHGLSYFKII